MRSDLSADDLETAERREADRRRRRRRIALAWCLVAIWAVVIWTLGGDEFSSASTSPTLLEWLRWLFEDLAPATKYRVLMGLRKSAHFVEYAILALLAFRAAMLSATRNQLATAALVALFMVATLATADEARQAFTPSRSGSPYDVLIDISGGLVATLGLVVISRRLRGHRAVLEARG
jgi:VanZ family protein